MDSRDINASFQKLIHSMWPHYKGLSIEAVDGGYIWGNVFYHTLDQIDEEYKRRGGIISQSVNRIKPNKNEQVKDNFKEIS
jgi:hypothetical protein